jgi:histone H3/H4
MSEIPIAPIERIIKKTGAQRVSGDAVYALRNIMEEWAEDIAYKAVRIARHSGRKTINKGDIEVSI